MFQFKSCVGNFSLRIFYNTKLVTFSQILSHSIIDSASIRNCNFFMHLLKASSLKANCHFITTGKIGFTCHFVNNGDWIHWSNCDQMGRKYRNTNFPGKKGLLYECILLFSNNFRTTKSFVEILKLCHWHLLHCNIVSSIM